MATTPATPAPPAPQQAPPPRRTNPLWWVLFITLGMIVALGALGIYLFIGFFGRVNISQTAQSVEISTPAGSIRAQKSENVDPGLPLYPGASISDIGAKVEVAGGEEAQFEVIAAKYRTIDPIAKVDSWYGEKLGAEFKREGAGQYVRKRNIVGVQVTSEEIAYISEKDDVVRVVALKKAMNGVEIALVRIAKAEPQ
jgi:hypothetical protein